MTGYSPAMTGGPSTMTVGIVIARRVARIAIARRVAGLVIANPQGEAIQYSDTIVPVDKRLSGKQ
jgi:hypothetical protein